MAKLIYVSNVSLDGFIEDEDGSFEWTAPSDEVLAFITELVRPVGTYLYGRRLYETMAVWESDPTLAARSELMADFAQVWRAADKIVYSSTLDAVSTAKSRLERLFDPDAVRGMKAGAGRDARALPGGPVRRQPARGRAVLQHAGRRAQGGEQLREVGPEGGRVGPAVLPVVVGHGVPVPR